MATDTKKPKDKDLAADTRPVPSQAEGDLDTIEEDLEQQEKKKDQ